jgi:hypothetical protein
VDAARFEAAQPGHFSKPSVLSLSVLLTPKRASSIKTGAYFDLAEVA